MIPIYAQTQDLQSGKHHNHESCPIYYCNEPCRVRNHVEKYSKIIKMGYECSML
jgi:hypothetical protein